MYKHVLYLQKVCFMVNVINTPARDLIIEELSEILHLPLHFFRSCLFID